MHRRARRGEWMSCWTMGLNQCTHGTWNTNALVNLHLATGAICRPGSGPFSLTGQPNAMGGREMGYMGPGLPGQRSVLVDERPGVRRGAVGAAGRHAPQGRCRARAPSRCSSGWPTGDIKACWIICTNPVASVANRRTVIEGLEAAELVITQDVFADTETNAYADVVLPGAMWAEAEGVMVNCERNLTLAQAAVDPPGDAWPTGRSSPRVACAMGFDDGFAYGCAEEVFEEIKRCVEPEDRLRPARRHLRAAARRLPCSGRRRPVDGPERNPDPLHSGAGGSAARCGSPPPSGRGCLPRPPASARRRNARRRLPVRAQHRAAAAPVAHHDQDRQGRQAQQAELRRRSSRCIPRTRERLGIARRRPGRGRLAARPGGAAGRGHRPGADRAAASRRSTGTTCSASTSASTR